jgi:hypothetical protein
VFAGVAYVLFLMIDRTLSINLDGAMYLDGAARLLEGGLPYIDFVDVNPPLAYYLHIPPVMLSRISGLEPTNAFMVLLIIATLASGFAAYRLLSQDDEAEIHRNVLVCLAPALLLLPLEPNFDLGQRSHLLMLAGFPYLVLRLMRNRGVHPRLATAILAGASAGLVLALKPAHYVAIIGAAEIYLLLRYRNIRTLATTETLTIGGVALLYGLFMLGLPEASSEAFFGTYLPLVLESYGAYASALPQLIDATAERVAKPLIIAIACGLLMRNDSNSLYRDISTMFVLVAGMATIVFLAQQKGWAYHAIPIWFGAYAAAACLAGSLLRNENRLARFIAATPILVGLTATLVIMSLVTKDAAKDGKKKLRAYVSTVIEENSAPGDTIYIMSTSVDATYPLVLQLDRHQATRFPFLFPVPLLYDNADIDPETTLGYRIHPERERLENDFLLALNTDLTVDKPELILIETFVPCLFCPTGLTLPNYVESKATMLPALEGYEHIGWTKRFKVLRKIETEQG